jgi:endoglycosylceramidase
VVRVRVRRSADICCAAQGLRVNENLPGSERNAKQAKLDALVTPYALATAGTPRSWSFDRKTATTSYSYRTSCVGGGSFAPGTQTIIFVPERQYPHGYAVRTYGARVVSGPQAPWLRLTADPGATIVRITITP